ncbi:MAG: ABC transporter substrate-binding protein [Amaricoccus sp.]
MNQTSQQTLSRRSALKLAGASALLPFVAGLPATAETGGGTLRFTVLDGYSGNTLDAGMVATWSDNILQSLVFDPLYRIGGDGLPEPVMIEAAEMDETGKVWTMKVRDATWQDGRPVTSKDLAFSLARIVDPDHPKSGATGLAGLDTASFEEIDDRTLRFAFKEPFAVLPDVLATYYFYLMVPHDFDPAKPVGSGAFKVESFRPGESAAFVRFDGYWAGRPALDRIEYAAFSDANAAVNALRNGQLDAFPLAPFNLLDQFADGSAGISVLATPPAQTIVFTMRADQPPFDDVRVRQALRLIAKRDQMVKVALAGHGEVASDLFAHLEPDYATDLTRTQDLAAARALLAEAGKENLALELIAYQGTIGMIEAAQVFARNAAAAGVTITVKVVPVDLFYGQYYLSTPFSMDYFSYNTYFGQASQAIIPGSPFDSTHWSDEEYLMLYHQALATPDPTARAALKTSMQRIEFERGAFIVPVRSQVADLVTSRLRGITPSKNGYPLGHLAWHKMTLDG